MHRPRPRRNIWAPMALRPCLYTPLLCTWALGRGTGCLLVRSFIKLVIHASAGGKYSLVPLAR